MSRTYRRKNCNPSRKSSCELYWFVTDIIWSSPRNSYYRVQYSKNSIEYKKGKAKFHSDSGTWTHKEPGPSWFRNLTSERRIRRKHKLELHKYILDNEYEPNIIAKGKLEYWT